MQKINKISKIKEEQKSLVGCTLKDPEEEKKEEE